MIRPVRVFTAGACLGHHPGPGFPEQPARLEAVLAAVRAAPGAALTEVPPAAPAMARLQHGAEYLERVAAMSRAGGGAFDADTPVDAHTWEAALGALGASAAALDHALATGEHAFAAVRPPGHHALATMAMGFCYLNQAAILSAEARARGRERVLIVDWDVHHGNGTQALVEAEPRTRFVSMHQSPWWPGSGAASERGCGNCFNRPMAGGLPAHEYVEAFWGGVTAATEDWTPELVIISAGYDGMRGDPLGGFTLEPEHFAAWITRMRERFPGVPLVGLMEGGYAPARLAAGVVATLEAMH